METVKFGAGPAVAAIMCERAWVELFPGGVDEPQSFHGVPAYRSERHPIYGFEWNTDEVMYCDERVLAAIAASRIQHGLRALNTSELAVRSSTPIVDAEFVDEPAIEKHPLFHRSAKR